MAANPVWTEKAKKLVEAAYATPRGRGKTRGIDKDQWITTIAGLLEAAWNGGYSAGTTHGYDIGHADGRRGGEK